MTLLENAAAAPAVLMERVLPVAGLDTLRIDVELVAREPAQKLDIYGFIIHAKSGNVLWQGALARTNLAPGQRALLSATVRNLRPELWEPHNPALYNLRVTALRGGRTVGETRLRFGFRSMAIESGQFYLNGRPVFLRGLAINPPGRTIPENTAESRAFAEAYVGFLKSQNVNIIRTSTDISQTWFDVCDELGMMLYAGRYGLPPGFQEEESVTPPEIPVTITHYKRLFEQHMRHPSIVMYYLANELPVSGTRGLFFSNLLTQAHAELRKWDPARPIIGNAGYGEGREGDVCDVHRYWGWYYNSFLTYYNLRDRLRMEPLFGDPLKNQPLTFTECVGAFTSSSGEFNVVRSKQLAPRLGWIGHTEEPRADAIGYQSFLLKQATESFRRMRPINPRLAGIMPFTILFDNWNGIDSFAQMKPKPALGQLAVSYQPVLLSWELWTPQVYAGSDLRPVAHVINDHERGRALTNATLQYELCTSSRQVLESFEEPLPAIGYFETLAKPLSIRLRKDLPTGNYLLAGAVVSAGKVISTNWTELFIAGKDWKSESLRPARELIVYDPDGKSADALDGTRVAFRKVNKITEALWNKPNIGLVIAENQWDTVMNQEKAKLPAFVQAGGRILILQQTNGFDTSWLPNPITFLEGSPNEPDYPPSKRPFREQMNVNPERPDHPVFKGVHRDHLRLWSDYSDWDQSRRGFPCVYPVTSGFKLNDGAGLATTAILADYDRGLEGVALCEMFEGSGSVMICGFDLVNRAGLDPVADRLMANLLAYLGSEEQHERYPLVEAPIRWGDFPTEKGTVCGSMNGLLVNTEWVAPAANPKAPPLKPNTGSWNLKPGDQFIPSGRNPFGAYTYSTASSLRDLAPDAEEGTGFFRARLPEGRRQLVTVVKNPGTNSAVLSISLSPDDQGHRTVVEGGLTLKIRVPLPENPKEVFVRYSGRKDLVLLETAFE